MRSCALQAPGASLSANTAAAVLSVPATLASLSFGGALVWAANAVWSSLRPVRSAVPAAETSFSNKVADYTRERPIGKGGFGKTWVAKHRPDGRVCAIKVITSEHEHEARQAMRECESAQALRDAVSPSYRTLLVEAYTCFVKPDKHQWWEAGIVMEHCAGGNLSRYLEEKAPLSEPIACQVLKPLLRALRGVHETGHVHCNLKPSNILLCTTGRPETLKLADFGLTRKVNSATSTRGGGGTRGYVSPEAERGRYVGESDMWALGVVAVQLCARPEDVRAIFDRPQVLRTEAQIIEFLGLIPTGYSAAFHAFARACLNLDFTVRPSAAQLLASELFAPDLLRFHLDHLLSSEQVRPPRRSAWRFHKNRSGRCVAHVQTYGRRLKILCSVFRDPLRADLHGLSHQARPPSVVTNGARPCHVRGAGLSGFGGDLLQVARLAHQTPRAAVRGADRGTSWFVFSPIARCASNCMRQVLAVDEEAHRASACPTCEAAAAVARCIQKIAPCFTFASEYTQNYDASRKRLEVPNAVRAECLWNDNKMIVLCRNADGRIGISTSSSLVGRDSRSARRSRTRLSCS